LILVDSSGWIEYLADRPRADAFAPYIEADEPPLVSVVSFYEVYKVIRRDASEERAVEAVSFLGRGEIVPVENDLALEAADAALEHGLAMADALIFATARRHEARIVTGDADFEGLPNATVIR